MTMMTESSPGVIRANFDALKAHAPQMALTTVAQRKAMLSKLLRVVLAHRVDIQNAMVNDYKRHPIETDLAETWLVIKEIKFAIRHLNHWMQPIRVPTSLAFFGARSQINYEAKGVVLIISPWNFPFNLSLSPLVSAIAAGNTVLIKPSEYTPHSSALIKAIIDEVFPPNVAFVAEGGLALSKELLLLPFNHIFFTGSPAVGKIVMKAAAEHLASVTLELGGKSPSVVDVGVNINQVAKQIVFSKFNNKGQVCIATDFVLVHEKIKDQFIDAVKAAITHLYGKNSVETSTDYARMVDVKHTMRIKGMTEDAVEKGATLCLPFEIIPEKRFVSPVILADVSLEMDVMREEIFGPILPIKTFMHKQDLMQQLHLGEKPLALHVFTTDKKLAEQVVAEISSGAVVINETFLHHFNSHLPFGGVNNSGIGKSHGHFGFLEFSNQKAVVEQWLPMRISALLRPPYGKFSKRISDFLLKFIS